MSKVVPTSSIFNEEGVELALCAREEEEEGAFRSRCVAAKPLN